MRVLTNTMFTFILISHICKTWTQGNEMSLTEQDIMGECITINRRLIQITHVAAPERSKHTLNSDSIVKATEERQLVYLFAADAKKPWGVYMRG